MKKKNILVIMAAAVTIAITAQATTLPINSSVVPASGVAFGGTQVAQLTNNFATAGLVGQVVSLVYANDPASPYYVANSGRLTFFYDLTLAFNQPGGDTASRMSMLGFGGSIQTDVEESLASLGVIVPPNYATRDPAGDVVGFTWLTPTVAGGQSSGWVQVNTDATFYAQWQGFVQDGGQAQTLVLTPAVPEPSTIIAGAMLLLPFGASTLRMLRKSRTV